MKYILTCQKLILYQASFLGLVSKCHANPHKLHRLLSLLLLLNPSSAWPTDLPNAGIQPSLWDYPTGFLQIITLEPT